MESKISEVMQFVEENDVKFIRLAFCDIFGTQKNISIMPNELPRAFEEGVSFDASSIRGFMNVEESDLFLVPDAKTLAILPWRPEQGRVIRFFCNIRRADGTSFEGDGRSILKKSLRRCMEAGYSCYVGAECEFYLFETDEMGRPTLIPHDSGGYCDIEPLDKGENVRREICLTLEKMGIYPESSHHESGPGQNEIDFHYSDALTAADNFITFKSVVRIISARNGLYATFLPKPFEKESGSGLHINLSLSKMEQNIFKASTGTAAHVEEQFIAGVLDKVGECTAFFNPLTNSYARFGKFEAPKYITWSRQNRSQLIRIPAASENRSRIELRSPDAECNPYLAFTLLLEAGLLGMRNNLPLSPPTDVNLYAQGVDVSALKKLPSTLGEAVEAARESSFINEVLPETVVDKYLNAKQSEWEQYVQSVDKDAMEKRLYFYQG